MAASLPDTFIFKEPSQGPRKGLQRWKAATRHITVVNRFGRKFSVKTLPCSIEPAIHQAKEFLQKSNAREDSITTNHHAGSGAHFSPGEAFTEGKPHPKRFKITPNNNGQEQLPKVLHASFGNWRQKVLTLFFIYDILNVADLLDHPPAVPITILVTVIVLAPDSDGTKVIIDRLMRSSNYSKGLMRSSNYSKGGIAKLLLLLYISFGIRGANAQDDGEDGASKSADEWAFVWRLLVGIITIIVCRWIIRRGQAVPPPAAPALALPPIAAPPAIAPPAIAPPAIAPPAIAPPAIAPPPPAIAPPPPAIAPPPPGFVIDLEPGPPSRSDQRFHVWEKL